MFCPECGKQNPEDNDFCQYCGFNLEKYEVEIKKTPTKNVAEENLTPSTPPSRFRGLKWVFIIFGGISIILLIIVFLETRTPVDTTSQISSEYNQEEIVASVVNIYCPSTVEDENISGGSGTIITDNGYVLTNSHIIPQDEEFIHVGEMGCIVTLPNPTTGQIDGIYLAHPVVLPELSDKYDLAFMEIYDAYYDEEEQKDAGIYPRKFPAFDDSNRCVDEAVKLGEPIKIFGYPAISGGGYSLTITDGLVSSMPGDGTIVTSAKISLGSSGGLAVDKNGCMIGVPTMVSVDEAESLGIIYSMDIVNEFLNSVSDLLETNPQE